MRLKTKICKEDAKMYNSEKTSRRQNKWVSLIICWLIILGGYLLIRMVFLIFGLQLHLAAQGACLAVLAILLWGAVSVEALQKAKAVVLCTRTPASCRCREADAVFPRRISVRGQSVPCRGGHEGDRKGRTVCGALYTDADAVRSQPAVF